MSDSPTIDQQLADLKRGCEALYTEDALRKKLASGRQLRIKLGMDPTAPDIHLGHTVVLRKMRQFQDLGHKAVLIIGDYTARIGDPTGRDATRPVLDETTIQANAQTYLDQAGLILDRDPAKFEMHYNSSWLGKLTFADVLQLTAQFTVQQMLHRDNFKKRMDKGVEIQVSEFMYPLMQAYDSVVIKADVELGGTDQTFNNLRGRDLMTRHEMEPQCVLIMPILVGLDGTEKMSKSKGNYVAVTDTPDDMFGKIMSITDPMMRNYYELLTPLPMDRITSLLDPSLTHPREAKDALAKVIIEEFHNADAANAASAEFAKRFGPGTDGLPTNIETKTVAAGDHRIIDLLVAVGFAASNGDAKRLIKGGGVKLDGEKVSDPTANVTVSADAKVLQVGKRNVCQIVAG
ncbi:MAG: tyrosine--tRNA ligase [Phycisphaera sp.]|nr:tyrosine--tRNA ligase [Phycisphaera sp.]